ANGATGTTRANATTNWIGQPSANWGQTLLSGTDYKFVDCNGDGAISPADTNAVVQNFGLMHNMRQGGAPVYDATLPDLTITMGQNSLVSNSPGSLTVALGSSAVPVSNLYGLAFTLNFDPMQIDASTFGMNETGTWMGTPGNDLMGVVMNNGSGTGSVQIALTRLDHQNINGFGNIANVGFMTTGNLVGTGNSQNVNFTISNVTVISANETPQTVNAVNDSVLVQDPGVLGIAAVGNSQNITAYPNPFDESVQIILPQSVKGKACVVTLTDASGRVVLTQQTGNANTMIIQRGQLEAGIYFCTIRSEGQMIGNTKLIVK
ncbi:MAG TPA: T9SS type A sorting domain-containing protein, partial [Bacteroidia bacterium]|nr:T9SS type A sorting domain-containing protein [Bacteroidia bacterium]